MAKHDIIYYGMATNLTGCPRGCKWDVSTTTVFDTFSLAPTRSTALSVSIASAVGSVAELKTNMILIKLA